jgi:putrescine---pyruvate transaminase
VARTAFLHPFARPAADEFLEIVRGEGAVITDADGNDYIDALASLWYCNVGHGRREVVERVTGQLERLDAFHTFERFTNPAAEEAAERLAAIAPFAGARVFFTSSGSEAVDSAIKLARFAHAVAGEPQRTIIVSRRPSYHGVTYGALTATGIPQNHDRFAPLLPDVVQVPHDDLGALDAIFAAQGERIAAVLAEPVVGAGGVHPPVDGYLEGLRRLCDQHGAFYVSDEVICGFGRLGAWWGVDHYGVTPDLVTFAKGVTSGYQPLGGVLVSAGVLSRLDRDQELVFRHGHTYSGHPAACAAVAAAMDVTEQDGLRERADRIGGRLRQGLEELVDGERIVGLRGAVAVWAAVLGDGLDAVAVREEMLTRGVIPRPIGGDTVAFCPPLVISDSQVDRCVETLGAAVEVVAERAT